MADHVAVGEVDSQIAVFARFKTLDELIRDLGALHPWPLLERHAVGRDLNVCFQLLGEFARLVTVPEIGYVTVFLCFGYGQL